MSLGDVGNDKLKRGDYEPDSGPPFLRGLGGSGVLTPTEGLLKHSLKQARSQHLSQVHTTLTIAWAMIMCQLDDSD